MKTKGELLEEYAGGQPQPVYRVDILREHTAEPDDDEDNNWEMRYGWETALTRVCDICIFFEEGIKSRDAVRLLRKVADEIENRPNDFAFTQQSRCPACGAVQPRPPSDSDNIDF